MIPHHRREADRYARLQAIRRAQLRHQKATALAALEQEAQRVRARAAALRRTIPALLPPADRNRAAQACYLAAVHLGRKALTRLHCPWLVEPQARTPRGRLRNPTALR